MICAYILQCVDGAYYVGSTSDIDRRLNQHRKGECRYTKSRLPVVLVFKREFSKIIEARRYEIFLKRQRNKVFYRKLIQGAIV